MSAKKRIGIIGFGWVAQNNHWKDGYALIPEMAEITCVCDINDAALAKAKEMLGLKDEQLFHDYRDVLKSGLVDAIDICTPNDVHCEIAHASIDAGIPFSIEKPIGLNYAEALKLSQHVQESGIPSFVCFTWRYREYTRYVRDLIKNGKLGQIYHIYISCIKDSGLWPGRRLEWRFDAAKGGTGVLGDLGSHMIDITRFWGEEFDGVFADWGTYVTRRQKVGSEEWSDVTTDDYTNIMARTKSGIPVTIALTRCATTIGNLICFDVYGANGHLKYTFDDDGQKIEVCLGDVDMEGKGTHTVVPPARYAANQSKSFVDMLNGQKDEYTSELVQGMECQKVLEAAEISCKEGRYVKISEIG